VTERPPRWLRGRGANTRAGGRSYNHSACSLYCTPPDWLESVRLLWASS